MFQKLLAFTKKVSDFADHVTGNAAANKAQFDAAPEELRDSFNSLIDGLKSTASGDSGAKNLGATAITGLLGTDVQSQLESLKNYADNLTKDIPHIHVELKSGANYAVAFNNATGMVTSSFDIIKNNGGWIVGTDKYKAPISGVYNIAITAAISDMSSNIYESEVYVYIYDTNGNYVSSYLLGTGAHVSGKWIYASGTINVYLQQGQQIGLIVKQDSANWQNYVSPTRMTATLVGKY